MHDQGRKKGAVVPDEVTSTLFASCLIAEHPTAHRSLFADQQCHMQNIVLDGEGDSASLPSLMETDDFLWSRQTAILLSRHAESTVFLFPPSVQHSAT
jgi:hypothetical protein